MIADPSEQDSENHHCVYIHTNLINGKKYIGQTKYGDDIQRRWRYGHGYQDCAIFHKAILKYGWDNFAHEILHSGLTQEEANFYEESYIKQYHTCVMDKDCWGYNSNYGGNNHAISDATREKLRYISTELWKSDDFRERACRGRKGRVASPETKAKLSALRKGRTLSEEYRRKISEGKLGKSFSDEHKKHLSENSTHSKKVKCIETDEIFDSCTDAAVAMGMNKNSRTHISRACKFPGSTSGTHPETGERLHWKYIDETEDSI